MKKRGSMKMNARFLEAIQNREAVAGYTHDFYRYPARFSPLLFMGGGTSLVEAQLEGRHAVGTDISSLAVFVAETKTTPLNKPDLRLLQNWAETHRESSRSTRT